MAKLVEIDTPHALRGKIFFFKISKNAQFWGFGPPLEGEPKEIPKNFFCIKSVIKKVGIYIKYEMGFV